MLKDKLSKYFNNSKKEKDPLNINIMDGFVNIKGYKVDKDGNKKLVYHDCGDNVVTDWMRHAIITLLSGDSFLPNGKNNKFTDSETSYKSEEQVSLFNLENHKANQNLDGYLVNKNQYFWKEDDTDVNVKKYSQTTLDGGKNIFAVFPTKVLFGTGKEYANWDTLQSENEIANASWYTKMLNYYGGGIVDKAKANFKANIEENCNVFSGTIIDDLRSGEGKIARMRTVNSPSVTSGVVNSDKSTNKSYGVVGAIKTPYFDKDKDKGKLNPTTTDSGTVLSPTWNGIGRPCFIYFNTPKGAEGSINEAWDEATSDVYLSKDSSSKYLNKITFKIVMPAQSASTNSVEAYYPYNGYTLRQIGLYNDAHLVNTVNPSKSDANDPTLIENMPCGTLLAIKDIMSLEKTAEMELVMTWTLTI